MILKSANNCPPAKTVMATTQKSCEENHGRNVIVSYLKIQVLIDSWPAATIAASTYYVAARVLILREERVKKMTNNEE